MKNKYFVLGPQEQKRSVSVISISSPHRENNLFVFGHEQIWGIPGKKKKFRNGKRLWLVDWSKLVIKSKHIA